MSESGQRWYVVHTHPHAEVRAETHLRRQGFDTYLPRYLKRRRHARRVDTVAAPLFPRYLFVVVDLGAQRWRSIQSTVGVSHLVSGSGDPTPVPDKVIEQLRGQEEGGIVQLRVRPKFSPGEPVRILGGAFSSYVGLFDGMKDDERVAVLMDLLGRKVRLVMDPDAIEAA